MFSADLGVNPVASAPSSNDPPFQKVALLLHGDGTNGAQNNTFVDSSTNNFTITRTGNVAQGTFSPFSLPEGQWSNYFDSSTSYTSISANTAFAFGTGDFTAEAWIYDIGTTAAYAQIVGASTYGLGNEFLLALNGTTKKLYAQLGSTGGSASSGTVAANTWNHVAVVRSGTTVTFYINGTSSGSYTDSDNVTSFTVVTIGAASNNNADSRFRGYISNVRVVKGTAVYTSNFTPSTTPLTAISGTSLLTCQSNRFKDNSSNNFTITRNGDTRVTAFSPFAPSAAYSASTNGGSAYFDGTGDYLQTPTSTSLDFGTGDFTVEAWVNIDNTVNPGRPDGNKTITVFSTGSSGSNDCSFAIYGNASTAGVGLELYQASPSIAWTVAATVTPNSWVHVAWVRSGTTIYGFVNGVRYTLGTSSLSISSGTAPKVGIANTTSYTNQFKGNISNLRIVNGTALYTANFTPPTAPLTAVTNTQLLLNFTNAGIIDNAGKNDIETVGNAQISTSVKKYGTGSMYFDGSGDYLKIPNTVDADIYSGSFCIEAWINPATLSGDRCIYATGWPIAVYVFSGGTLAAIVKNGVNAPDPNLFPGGTLSGGAITANTWTHIAFTRENNTYRIFNNGLLINSYTAASGAPVRSTASYFGIGNNAVYASNFNGYIDDLRITKGQALYTSNFTPPTQAFPNV